jgi:hypothetical protein
MTKNILTAAIIVFTIIASSHGEDKLGPHGGFIKMPGGFHTEAVPITNNQIKIYLLDIEWKNPTIENSSVTVNSLPCKPERDVFLCDLGGKSDLKKKGILNIEATRLGQKGNSASYELPLSLPKTKTDHKHH